MREGVQTKGDRIDTTKQGRAIADVEPVAKTRVPLKGLWKSKGKINGNIVNFSDDPWEVEAE